MTLLVRLRRASSLRVLLVIATLLASQTALACAFEAAFEFQSAADVADVDASDGIKDDCCTMCVDCAHCGGCHSSLASPRSAHNPLDHASIAYAKISLADAAPTLWTPPALLRPPISEA
jgi:hypothetical protein